MGGTPSEIELETVCEQTDKVSLWDDVVPIEE
jgi:hypothetical protein